MTPALDRSRELAADVVGGLGSILASRTLRPVRPDRLLRLLRAQRRFGVNAGFLLAAAAELHPERAAVIDEAGSVSFAALDAAARALAGALHSELGLGSGSRLAIICRNHRGFVEASAAVARLGADLVPLNSDFAGPQLGDVLAREGVAAAIHDAEFAAVLDASGFAGARILADADAGHSLAALRALGAPEAPAPDSPGRTVLLTSGTTGTPKGAVRTIPARALLPLALAGLTDLARIKPTPRSGNPIVVAPPLFHLYGQIGLMAGLGLGSPIVIRRRFDPEATLAGIAEHGAGVLLAVPTMLKRIVDLPPATGRRYDTSTLQLIASGAAPLAPELSTAVMDRFGEVLYNGYASTEVGAVTLATPADLRAAPGTVGRPTGAVSIRILDADGRELPQGETGRIFVGSPMLFDGYTGGGGKEVIDARMSTGDVGHFDTGGRLFVDGRDDDMILSGGENVFPQEVEETLLAHPGVADAAVSGVPDPDFGQRLTAYVVAKPGAELGAEALQDHVRGALARFKVPREIEFVDALPRTSTGKLQRRRLDELDRTEQ